MRSQPTLSLFLGLLLGASGCAHTIESTSHERTVVAVDTASSTTVITEAPAVVIAEPAVTRPRLSQVVTLGQESYSSATPPAMTAGATGTNVTVNNNITVVNQQQQPAYGVFGGYGYGYGGGRSGVPGVPNTGGSSHQAWAPNGWEGARRTAAPGATPAVGGNWAPAPSHGPAQMK